MTEDEKRAQAIARERRVWWELRECYARCVGIAHDEWDAALDAAQEAQQELAVEMRDRVREGTRATGAKYEVDYGIPVPLLTPRDRAQFVKEVAVTLLIVQRKKPMRRRALKRGPASMKRSKMPTRSGWLKREKPLRAKGAKRSRFPKRRHPEYRGFVRSQPCVLAGRYTAVRFSTNDEGYFGPTQLFQTPRELWRHVCWGPIDPAHVNETQARGAYDVGEIVPLCRGAHRMLDQVLGPAEFAQVTGLDLTHLAAGYPQAFVERGGTL